MFKDFKEISKDEWIHKIEKEYRGQKRVDNLYQKIGELIDIHPFHHSSDNSPIFRIDPFPASTKFGFRVPEKFDQKNQLSHLLNQGIQLLIYDHNSYWNEEEANKIHWDYLFTVAHQGTQSAEYIHDYLTSNKKNVGNYLKISNSKSRIFIDLELIYNGVTNFNSELEKLQQLHENADIVILLSDYFLFNIGILRGLKQFLLQKFSGKNRPMVIAQCKNTGAAPEESLISETTQITSAILSGIENVLFSSSSEEWIQRYQSMIPHLLYSESQLNFKQDPICGSNYLDSISWQVYNLLSN